MFNTIHQFVQFRQSLTRVGVADGGIVDNPAGEVSSPGQYPPPGITAYGPSNSCSTTSPSSIDCGALSTWDEGFFKTY